MLQANPPPLSSSILTGEDYITVDGNEGDWYVGDVWEARKILTNLSYKQQSDCLAWW
jgi:hypothetical protein